MTREQIEAIVFEIQKDSARPWMVEFACTIARMQVEECAIYMEQNGLRGASITDEIRALTPEADHET